MASKLAAAERALELNMKIATLRKLERLESKLLEAERRQLLGRLDWKDNVPATGGVYAIWRKNHKLPIYVGETCHLNHRFGDIGKPNRHTFHRKGLRIIGSKARSAETVSMLFSANFQIAYLTIEFGRTELEEYLFMRWGDRLVNKAPRRLTLTTTYDNVSL